MNIPWTPLLRVWNALRRNPCTVEIINWSYDGQQRVRVRNDSGEPTEILDVGFTWGWGWYRKSYLTPEAWSSCEQTLDPARSFEHRVDAHEIGQVPHWCEIKVHHNRSAHPATKLFIPRVSKAHRRRLKSRRAMEEMTA